VTDARSRFKRQSSDRPVTVVFSRFDGAVDSGGIGLLRRRSWCFRFLITHMLSDHRSMMVVGININNNTTIEFYFPKRHWMQEDDLILRAHSRLTTKVKKGKEAFGTEPRS
ncbi:hypothetical protein M8C21_015649, partial [Ambrosia artemisiifolia]